MNGDTTNATDTVLPATGLSDYLFDTEKMTDGAMLAWKTIILRTAVSETICSPSGANASGGGMAGPGGDGGPGGPGGDGALGGRVVVWRVTSTLERAAFNAAAETRH